MSSIKYFLVVVVMVLVMCFNQADVVAGLRCWKCSSEFDSTCRDHFNVTRILQNQRHINEYAYGNSPQSNTEPYLSNCEGMHTSTFGRYKNVCMKKVITVPDGPKQVVRECRMVNKDLSHGDCPEDVVHAINTKHLEYCGTCDYDECNSASRIDGVYTILAPVMFLMFFKLFTFQ